MCFFQWLTFDGQQALLVHVIEPIHHFAIYQQGPDGSPIELVSVFSADFVDVLSDAPKLCQQSNGRFKWIAHIIPHRLAA